MFAGFTHCPDVCPTTLALLKNLERSLGPDAQALEVLFLTVDPERDTPERMGEYVRYFSPAFTGVTGSLTEIDKLTSQLGLAYAKIPGETPADYTMDHSAALVLLNPEGRVFGYFSPPFQLEALAADLRPLLGAHG